jgi:hypothetical protein
MRCGAPSLGSNHPELSPCTLSERLRLWRALRSPVFCTLEARHKLLSFFDSFRNSTLLFFAVAQSGIQTLNRMFGVHEIPNWSNQLLSETCFLHFDHSFSWSPRSIRVCPL